MITLVILSIGMGVLPDTPSGCGQVRISTFTGAPLATNRSHCIIKFMRGGLEFPVIGRQCHDARGKSCIQPFYDCCNGPLEGERWEGVNPPFNWKFPEERLQFSLVIMKLRAIGPWKTLSNYDGVSRNAGHAGSLRSPVLPWWR